MDIKFRVWDKVQEKWLDPKSFAVCGNGTLVELDGYDWQHLENDNHVVQQFTGLQDGDENDIYEGDIVEVVRPESKFVVRFGNVKRDVVPYDQCFLEDNWYNELEIPCFYFENILNKKAYFWVVGNVICGHDRDLTVVVGNILENPELITNTV